MKNGNYFVQGAEFLEQVVLGGTLSKVRKLDYNGHTCYHLVRHLLLEQVRVDSNLVKDQTRFGDPLARMFGGLNWTSQV